MEKLFILIVLLIAPISSFAATIYSSNAAGGAITISPLGATIVTDGQSQTFTISPANSAWRIYDVLVDGYSVGAVGSYTFIAVTGTHSIQVYGQIVPTVNVYVDPSAGSNGNGTIGSPYNTFAGITWTRQTAYLVKRGTTYLGQLFPNTDNVTIGAYGTGAKPIITYSGGRTVYINSRWATVLQDLDIRCDRSDPLYLQAAFAGFANVIVRNCNITVLSGSSSAVSLFSSSGSYSMTNFVFEGNTMSAPLGNGLFIDVYGSDFHDIIIRGNTFSNIHGNGISLLGDKELTGSANSPYGIVIDNNTFSYNHRCAIYTGAGLRSVVGHPNLISRNTATEIGDVTHENVNAFQLSQIRGTIVEYNKITNVYTSVPDGDGIIIDFGYADNKYLSDNVIVRYNIVTGARTSIFSSGINIYKAKNSKIYYNISYGNGSGITIMNIQSTGNFFYNNTMYANVLGINIDEEAPVSTWINNISSKAAGTMGCSMRVFGGGGPWGPATAPIEFFNVLDGHIEGAMTPDQTDILADPLFVDAENNDFHLKFLSPAVKSGVDVGLTQDYAGRKVQNRAQPSIGAYDIAERIRSSRYSRR